MGSIQNLTSEETWQWHAYTYAFRRVMLSNRDAFSPIDPHGQWYDKGLVDAAENEMRERARSKRTNDEARYAEAREWREQFAKERGFADFGEVMKHGIAYAFRRRVDGENPNV